MRCAACMTVNPAGNRFCGSCGAVLGAAERSDGLDPWRAGPGGAVLPGWGEIKQATVLFADIVSSTEQIAALDPEQAMDRLQPAIQRMCDAVENFGGTVVRTLGDGLMAMFGVPKALEGHARLACEAALRIQSLFGVSEQGWRIRVGLHSGQVAWDPAYADGSKGGGVHGLAIHLASRVMTLAEPGTICLTEDCCALIRPDCELRSLGRHELKGFAEPVAVYALLGLKSNDAGRHFFEPSLTPFQGRHDEMEMLRRALQLSFTGDAQVVGVSAAPGTGKSRLCFEFAQWCRTRSIPVYEVRTQLYGHATQLQTVLELLRNYFFRLLPSDDALVARSKVVQRLSEIGLVAQGDLALLFEFLGLTNPDTPLSQYNPKVRRARLKHIIRDLFCHVAATPSVVIIEDLQWLDVASEEFIDTLVTATLGTKALLVFNYRPGYLSPWKQLKHFKQIDLAELDSTQIHAMVRGLVGTPTEIDDVCQLVAVRSGGNPFFAEELVRSLADGGILATTNGVRARKLVTATQALPSTVQAVVGARIDRLGESQKMVLQMCAIIGKEFPLAVLTRVGSAVAGGVEMALEALCHAEMLQPQAAEGGRRFVFRHPLIQEVAYGMQLKTRRAAIHAAVAAAMEVHYNDRLDEFSGLIGHHYEMAGRGLEAATHVARAARWVGSTDSAQAIKHWHKVRAVLEDHPSAPESDRLRAMASSHISALGWREGLTLDVVQPFIDEATRLAGQVDGRLVQLLMMIEGRMLQATGGPADAYVECVNRAIATLSPGESVGRAATLHAALCQAYGWAGLLDQALAANEAALRGVSSIDNFDHEFVGFNIGHWVLGMRGRLLIQLGRFEEADQSFEQMLLLADASNDPVIRQMAHHGHVELAWYRNDRFRAQEHVKSVEKIAQANGSPYSKVLALCSSGLARFTDNDYERAGQSFTEALSLIKSTKVAMEFETEMLAHLAECHLRVGKSDDALPFALEAIRISRQRSNRLSECRALITFGAALIHAHGADRSDEAVQGFDDAEKLIHLTGAKIYEAALLRERSRLTSLERNRQSSPNAEQAK
jgi:adenylate cyclase